MRGTFKIDPTKRPRRMDATTPAGEVSLGIYEVEGDDYRVCFAPPGEERPRAFGSEPGSGYIYQVWSGPARPPRAMQDRFQGRWTMILGEREGRTLSDEEVASAGLTIAGNKYSYTLGGRAESGTFTLDLSRTPKGIDVTPEGGKPMLGIYQIDGETHKVCLAEPGRERPTEFTTQPEGGRSLYVMRRAKPAAQAPSEIRRVVSWTSPISPSRLAEEQAGCPTGPARASTMRTAPILPGWSSAHESRGTTGRDAAEAGDQDRQQTMPDGPERLDPHRADQEHRIGRAGSRRDRVGWHVLRDDQGVAEPTVRRQAVCLHGDHLRRAHTQVETVQQPGGRQRLGPGPRGEDQGREAPAEEGEAQPPRPPLLAAIDDAEDRDGEQAERQQEDRARPSWGGVAEGGEAEAAGEDADDQP